MLKGVEHSRAYLREQGFKRRVAGDNRSQHERVNEVAGERCELGFGSARSNRANRQLVLARVAMEQRLKSGEQRHVKRRVVLTAQRFQSTCSCGAQP